MKNPPEELQLAPQGNRFKHGCARTVALQTPEYRAWCRMKTRCTNPKSNRYQYYGGRGITISKRWLHNFPNFLADMGECPEGRSLGRIDNDGNYEPGNCRWETATQQARNKSNAHLLTANGKTMSISQWVKKTGKSEGMIRGRIARCWPVELALSLPTKRPDLTYRK